MVYIVEDTSSPRKLRFRKGRATIVFDKSGIVYLRSLDGFSHWLQYHWQFIDGQGLAYGPEEVVKGEVGVYDISAGGSFGGGPSILEFFVGTPAEYKKEQPAFTPPPL